MAGLRKACWGKGGRKGQVGLKGKNKNNMGLCLGKSITSFRYLSKELFTLFFFFSSFPSLPFPSLPFSFTLVHSPLFLLIAIFNNFIPHN